MMKFVTEYQREVARTTAFCERLSQLPGETLAQLAGNGMLEPIYAHLLSMRHFGELLESLAAASTV
jgi:hypothetical protein